MSQGLAGHKTHINGHFENVFDAQDEADVDDPFAFGWDTQMTTSEARRELQRIYQPGSKEALDIIDLHFEGSATLQFTLANPWVLRGILGSPSTSDNGDGSHTHTYTVSEPSSMRIYEGYTKGDAERILTGFVPGRISIDVNVQEEAQVTVEGGYVREFVNTNVSSLTPQQDPQYDAMTFVEAGVDIGGTTEGYVQQMTLEAQANVDMVSEMGTAFFIDYIPKAFEPSVNFTRIKAADEVTKNIEDLYAGQTSVSEEAENHAAVNAIFDNGQSAGSGINKMDFEAGGTLPESYDESGAGDPTADLEETINRVAQSLQVVATNGTSTAV